jgi:hypothetical protein
MSIPSELQGLMRMAAGEDWAWAAAVVERESNFNAYAVGDGTDARGFFQMHLDFIAWMYPEYGSNGAMLQVMHSDPFAQAVAFNRFWRRHSHLDIQRRLEVYHYGLTATDRRYEAKEDTDPDETVKHYFENHSHFTDETPEYQAHGKPAAPEANDAIAAAAEKAKSRVVVKPKKA